MQPVDDALVKKALQPDRPSNTVPCRSCGATVRVDKPGEQWTVRCASCGQRITLTRAYRERRDFVKPEKTRTCAYCRGTGIIELPRQIDEQIAKFAYRCICQAGQARRETAIPMAVDVDLAPLLRRW